MLARSASPDGKTDLVRLYFVGLFVNLFAPGTIAGDIARGIGAGGAGGRAAAFAGVVAHRLSGLVALLLLAGVAALVQSEYALPRIATTAAVVIPLLALASLLAAPRLLAAAAAVTGRGLDLPVHWIPATGRTLVLAGCYHALQIASMILLGRSLEMPVAATTLALFVPLANVAGMIPITVSGIGVREAVYVALLGAVGVAAESALALGLLGSGLVLAAGLIGAPAFLMPRPASSPSGRD